jgi:hypothetical protein
VVELTGAVEGLVLEELSRLFLPKDSPNEFDMLVPLISVEDLTKQPFEWRVGGGQ